MNLLKKIMMASFVCMLALALGGCNTTTPIVQEPEELAATVIAKMNNAKSVGSTINYNAKTVTGAEESQAGAQVVTEKINAPYNIKIVEKREIQNETPSENQTYAREENGMLVSYAAYGNQWIKQKVDKEEFLNASRMYDVQTNAVTLLENAASITEVSREDKVITLDILIAETEFQKMADTMQLFQMLGLSGLPAEYLKGVGDLNIQFAVDESAGMLISYHMDLTNAAQTLMDNVNHYLAGATTGDVAPTIPTVTVEHYTIDAVINSIDTIEKITIPKEAIDSAVDVAEQLKMNEQLQVQLVEDEETMIQEPLADSAGE